MGGGFRASQVGEYLERSMELSPGVRTLEF